MTDQDKFSLRGQLLADIERAEENFAYRREQALRLASGLHEAANKIELSSRLEPSSEDFEVLASLDCHITQDAQSLFDFDGAIALLAGLKKDRQTIYNLRMRNSLMSRRSAANTL